MSLTHGKICFGRCVILLVFSPADPCFLSNFFGVFHQKREILGMPSVEGEENGEEEVERSPNEDENMSEDEDEESSLSSDESSSESSS